MVGGAPLLALLSLAGLLQLAQAFRGIEGLYCGLENCYDVLGAGREATRDELSKLYRSLARKWHPDKYQDPDQKAEATEKFRKIATAFEVLKEDDSRKDYNDMLDDPEHYYRHYYRYYNRVYGTKVAVHWVILFLISAISLYQYFVMHSRYQTAIDYCTTVPKYRFRAQEIAKQRGLLPIAVDKKSADKKDAKKSRAAKGREAKELEEAIIRRIVEENMDIRGGFSKPDIRNILWIQLFYLPVFLYNYVCWYCRWVYLFNIKNEPYGQDEKVYLISKNLNMSEDQLYAEEDVDALLRQELWQPDKFEAWSKRREEEMRERMAEKPGYKRYRRFLKKGGAGQITFQDD